MKNRIFGLDLLRAIAVNAVLLSHFGYVFLFGMRFGFLAIESFFVMSGLLIGEMLIRDFKDGFTFKDLRIFWIKRWFRTLPLYYAVLLLKFVLIDPSIGWNLLYYIFFLQNNFYGIDFMDISWTLVLEEWFYIIMPVIIFLFFRKGINAKKFYLFTALVIGIIILLRLLYVYNINSSYSAINGNVVLRFDSFLIGVCLAAVKLFNPDIFKKMANPKFFSIGLFLVISFWILYTHPNGFESMESINLISLALRFSIFGVLIAMILPFFCLNSMFVSISPTNVFARAITWLSLLSYPMYLIHAEMNVRLPIYFPDMLNWNHWLQLGFKYILAILMSLCLYFLVHEPFIKLRTRIVGK